MNQPGVSGTDATSLRKETQLSVPQVQSPVCWYHPWIDLTSPALPDEEKDRKKIQGFVFCCQYDSAPVPANYSGTLCRKRKESVVILKENSWALAGRTNECQHFWNLFLDGGLFENDFKVLGICLFLEGQLFIPGMCLQVNPPVTNGLEAESKQCFLL